MGWVKLDNTMPEHPKVLAAGPIAAWLHVCALAYCDRHLTDGRVPSEFVSRSCSIRGAKTHAKKLVSVGLWRQAGDSYEIHDYLGHQRSRAEVEGQRQATAERVKRHRNAKRNAVTNGGVTPDVTPVRVEESSSLQVENVPDPEHVRLSELLADLIAENGSKRPSPLKWPNDVRLMVERDGRKLESIEAAIRWAQGDDFWRANVMSMPKLRKQYDKLRLAAAREQKPAEKPKWERHAKVTLLGHVQACRQCEDAITNEQANNQSGMCDDCYEAHIERLTGPTEAA